MKKIALLLGVLGTQFVFAQNEELNFEEVENSGLPAFYGGSMIDGDINGQKALLITGMIDNKPSTRLYLSDGNKFILNSATFPGVREGQAVFLDIDKDGDQDIALIGKGADKRYFQVYENDNGTFTLKQDLNDEALENASIDARDYNNDGYPDVVVTGGNGSRKFTKLFQNVQGNLEKKSANLQGVEFGAAKFIDMKGDGKLGIVISGHKDNDRYGTLVVYKQEENGEFTILKDYYQEDYGNENVDIAVGKADNNDREDFIPLGRGYLDNTNLFYAEQEDNGDISYSVGYSTEPFSGNNSKNTVLLKDLDNDSALDLVLIGHKVGEKSPQVYIHKGRKDFGFEDSQNLDFMFGSDGSVATVDFDNDGDLDLAISGKDANGNTVSKLYKNTIITLSNKEISKAEHIKIYPNPVTDVFAVEGLGKVNTVNVYDMSGRLVKSFIGQEKYYIGNLLKGNYIIVVKSDKGTKQFQILKK